MFEESVRRTKGHDNPNARYHFLVAKNHQYYVVSHLFLPLWSATGIPLETTPWILRINVHKIPPRISMFLEEKTKHLAISGYLQMLSAAGFTPGKSADFWRPLKSEVGRQTRHLLQQIEGGDLEDWGWRPAGHAGNVGGKIWGVPKSWVEVTIALTKSWSSMTWPYLVRYL